MTSKKKSKKGKIPSDKIKCPDCDEIIEEGLTFCPECGNRIPPWAKFNQDSSTSIL